MDEILPYMYNLEAKWICSTLINALGHARQRTIVTQGTKIHSISRNKIKSLDRKATEQWNYGTTWTIYLQKVSLKTFKDTLKEKILEY